LTLSFFDDPGADNVDMFGGKAASLAKLGSAGRIPPGFTPSVEEFQKWVDDGSDKMPANVTAEIKQAYTALERLYSVIDVPVRALESGFCKPWSDPVLNVTFTCVPAASTSRFQYLWSP